MDFVSFKTAKKLEEKGFKEGCLLHYTSTGGFYSNEIDTYDRPNQFLDYSDFLKCFNVGNSIGLIDAPTISQALKWLRERKKIHICISYSDNINTMWEYEVILLDGALYQNAGDGYMSYEEAALAGIEYVLDNLI